MSQFVTENHQSSFYAGKKALLIGGLGFVGQHLARELASLGVEVTILDRSQKSIDKEISEKIHIIHLNPLEDFHSFETYLKNADLILNLIQIKEEDFEIQSKLIDFNLKLLLSCTKNKLSPILVHFGSRLEYSSNNEMPLTESSALGPMTAYGLGKMLSEAYYKFFNVKYGLNTICLRISNVYGPNPEKNSKGKGVIDILLAGIEEKNFFIHEDVNRYKDFIYIEDFISALISCMKEKKCYGEVFNISSGEKIKFIDLAEKMRKIFEYSEDIKINKGENISDFSFYMDNRKLMNFTGWKVKTDIDSGLRKMKEEKEKTR